MQWILLVIIISLLVGALRGGSLRNLSGIRVKMWWLLLVGFVLLAAASFVPGNRHELAVALILISYLPLLAFILLNRKLSGIWIAGLGILMNFTVIVANGGMPVLAEAALIATSATGSLALDAKHVLLTPETTFPFLGDVIPLPGAVLSLGDVLLALGTGVFLEHQMRKPLSLFAHGVPGVPGSASEHKR